MFRIKPPKSPRRAGWFWETLVVVAAVVVALSAVQAWAIDKPESRKMARQMDVMEQIMDQVLLDSPNFLVSGRNDTHGLYVKSFGMIFTFEASLVGKDSDEYKHWGLDGFRIEMKDGERVIVIGPDDPPEPPEPREPGEESEEDSGRSWAERRHSRHERVYKRGKIEVIDVLLDYGDTITSLEKGQWVAFVVKLIGADFFEDNKMSHLILKAKIDDLRAYAGDKISEKEMINRIVEVEY